MSDIVERLREAALSARTTERVLCDKAADEIERLRAENERLRVRKDGAYEERNRVVALLASLYPSGTAKTNIPGWHAEWHGCVYIDMPTGQASWHYHDSQAHLFAHLPSYQGKWDGHDTAKKYERVARAALGEEKK